MVIDFVVLALASEVCGPDRDASQARQVVAGRSMNQDDLDNTMWQ